MTPASTVELLDRFAERLRAAKEKGENSIVELPRWIPGGESANPGNPGPETVSDLLKILREPGSAERRALAALWLKKRTLPALEDLDAVAVLLESTEPACLPSVVASQCAGVTDVDWVDTPLSEVAGDCLRTLTGKSFEDRRAFEAWKSSAPDPTATHAVWYAALQRLRYQEETLPELIKLMDARDPRLVVRIFMAWPGGAAPMKDDEIIARACAMYGRDLLWKYYSGEESWDDPDYSSRADGYRSWLERNAERIYSGSGDPGFLRTWERGKRNLPSLAIAAAALHPLKSGVLLKEALDRINRREHHAPLLARLIQDHYPGEWPYLRNHFWRRWSATPNDRLVELFLTNLVDRPEGRIAIRELVTDARFDEAREWDIQRLVYSLSPIIDFPRGDDIGLSKYYYDAALDPSIRTERIAKSKEAVRDCLARAREALR